MTISRSITAAAALAALLAGGGAAAAQGFGGGDWYAKGFGGATFPSEEDANLRDGGTRTGLKTGFDYDTGYTLGVALGYQYTPNVGLELEYAYRRADATGRLTGGPINLKDDGDTTANALMFNAIYTFDDLGGNAAWQPYVGAGLGGADLETSMYDGNWKSDTVFAYQFIGGVGYQVAPQWTLFGEARYFGTQGSEFDGPDRFNFDAGFDTIDLLVGAKLSF